MIDIHRLAHGPDSTQYAATIERIIAFRLEEIAKRIMPLDEDDVKTHSSSFTLEPKLSTGLNFDYDFRLGYATFELKCSNKPNLRLEVESKGNPSGLWKSKSDFYIFVNLGWSNDVGDVWKLRIIPTSKLRKIITDQQSPLHVGEDYRYYSLSPKNDLPSVDGWVADLSTRDLSVIKVGFDARYVVGYCSTPWLFN